MRRLWPLAPLGIAAGVTAMLLRMSLGVDPPVRSAAPVASLAPERDPEPSRVEVVAEAPRNAAPKAAETWEESGRRLAEEAEELRLEIAAYEARRAALQRIEQIRSGSQ